MFVAAPWTRGLLAAALAVTLLAGPLAPGLLALSGGSASICSMHGQGCTCPEMCKRGAKHESDGHRTAPAAAHGPACHRQAAPAQEPEPKPACKMNQCGRQDPELALSSDPAEPAAAWHDPLWRSPALSTAPIPDVLHAPGAERVPPAPPPRLFS
ncbi:MAG: hypothetical protein GC160_25810 [Acidobacteria bacterium]|nr:hypothetical protein [Acidobacteriota bacterium]